MAHKNPFSHERLTVIKATVDVVVVAMFLAGWALIRATNHTDSEEPAPIPTPTSVATAATILPGQTTTPSPTTAGTAVPTATAARTARAS
jgi:hypothetical protein